MTHAIEFWFDFASPYSWLSAQRVEDVAARAGRNVAYRAMLLGPLFQALHGTSDSPFNRNAPRGAHMWRDVARCAEAQGLSFMRPGAFPRGSLLATRIALLAEEEPWVGAFVRAVFDANFARDLAVGDEGVVRALLAPFVRDVAPWVARAAEPGTKAALRARTDEALARGIFGAPTFFVDGAMFWGNDRLAQLPGTRRFATGLAARDWAERWAEDWNLRDLAAVLSRFHDDVVFESPLAERVVGQGRVAGKAALSAYWTQALAAVGSVHFRVERALFDGDANELVVVYASCREGVTKRKTEHFRFRGEQVAHALAFDGTTLQ